MTKFVHLLCMGMMLAIAAMAAKADTRSVYTISDVAVDVSAETAQEAEALAFSEAKRKALRELVSKLTLPADRANARGLSFDAETAEYLSAAVEVIDEKRSSRVYRGVLSIVFVPSRVRDYLDNAGLPYVDSQAELQLLAPVASDLAFSDLWRDAWPDQNLGALSPFVKGLALYGAGSTWPAFLSEADAIGARTAVVAELIGEEGSYRVKLSRATPNGVASIGITNRVPDMETAVDAATSYLDAVHKSRSVVRDRTRVRTTATVVYSDIADWIQLRTGLVRSALVSEFRVDAVSRDGALVTFEFAGGRERLESELRQRGIQVMDSESGWVLQSAYTPIP